jgi:hypothetical protein
MEAQMIVPEEAVVTVNFRLRYISMAELQEIENRKGVRHDRLFDRPDQSVTEKRRFEKCWIMPDSSVAIGARFWERVSE